eukprot:TRINITY_DN10019_c0_g1_i1.p1 TRINITY_DN10019_c0_g1~~TRINITY_DN10019_c0_g1_i1.p1  ORF type:complete len:619 (-),score=153.20 TRINITY_DN10019_c0_g1_i1:74-1930(-)
MVPAHSAVTDWQSPAIPATIRRPWQVYSESLEDQFQDGSEAAATAKVAALQAKGALACFQELPEEEQHQFVNISIMELSAFVNWRRAQVARQEAGEPAATEFDAGWDMLDIDDKEQWLPENPSALLAADGQWASLLADGPARCGDTANAPGVARAPLKAEIAQAPPPPPVKAELATAPKAASAPTAPVKTERVQEKVQAAPAPLMDQERVQEKVQAAPAPLMDQELPSEGLAEEALRLATAGKSLSAAAESSSSREKPGRAHAPEAVRRSRRINGDSDREDAAREAEEQEDEDENADADAEERAEAEKVQPGGAKKVIEQVTDNRRRSRRATAPVPTEGPVPTRRGGIVRKVAMKGRLAPENLCPEALQAVCCKCQSGTADDTNDLAMCDRCDRAFHQRCHDPPISCFGNPEDQWFCSTCTLELAKMRKLSLKVGDFTWAQGNGDPHPWPARVVRIDFSSLADPKPYWVQYYDTGAVQGTWAGESQVIPWEEGPTLSSIIQAKRRNALRLAEADGAPPCRDASSRPIPRQVPAPRARPEQPTKKRVVEATSQARVVAARGHRNTRRRSEAIVSERSEDADEEDFEEAAEMRRLIQEAKERQRRVEKEIEESSLLADVD